MNVWAFGLLLSIFIWSLLYAQSLVVIYLIVLGLYTAMNFYYQQWSLNTFRRKVQIATWNDSGDPSVFGRIEVDMTKIDAFMEKHNAENPDSKLTYTVIFARALGHGLGSSEKLCGKICFGQFIPQASVDISVLVDIQGQNLANVVLTGCNTNTFTELNNQLRNAVKDTKSGNNREFNKQMNTMAYLPSFVIQAVLRVTSWLCYDLGLDIPLLKAKKHHYGFGILTNVTAFNVYDASAPLVPFTKSVVVALMNTPKERPIVVNGQIEIRKVMNFNLTYDHRFGDGVDAVKMLQAVTNVCENPENYI